MLQARFCGGGPAGSPSRRIKTRAPPTGRALLFCKRKKCRSSSKKSVVLSAGLSSRSRPKFQTELPSQGLRAVQQRAFVHLRFLISVMEPTRIRCIARQIDSIAASRPVITFELIQADRLPRMRSPARDETGTGIPQVTVIPELLENVRTVDNFKHITFATETAVAIVTESGETHELDAFYPPLVARSALALLRPSRPHVPRMGVSCLMTISGRP
jgi:hypothetical protein